MNYVYNFLLLINNTLTNIRHLIEFNYDKYYCYFKKLNAIIDYDDRIGLLSIFFIVSIQLLMIYFNYLFLISIMFDYYLLKMFLNFRNNIRGIDSRNNMIELRIMECQNYDLFVGQWQGLRPYMEDHYALDVNKNIFCVIDGHGGDQIGKFISDDFMFNYLMISFDNNNDQNTMEKTFISYEKMTKNMKSGCVLSSIKLNINNDELEVTNVGDTYVIVVYNDGSYDLVNRQHTLYDYDEYLRYGRKIRLSSVMRTKTGLIPTRTIGDHSHKNRDDKLLFLPETKKINLKNWKYILNCSDGLFDGLSINQAISIIDKYDNIDHVMREIQIRTTKNKLDLYDKIFGCFYGDNCTLMIIKRK